MLAVESVSREKLSREMLSREMLTREMEDSIELEQVSILVLAAQVHELVMQPRGCGLTGAREIAHSCNHHRN